MNRHHSSSACFVGLMSGTSMDSLDAALVDFGQHTPHLLGSASQTIGPELKQQLLQLCASFNADGETRETDLLKQLDEQLAEQFSQLTLRLIREQDISPEAICAIGSHGQTVFHRPPVGTLHGFSLQIANPQIIAQRTGIQTIGDFRNADMQQGGQGAPLVPAFHRAVFSSTQHNRVIVNIGGIANITILARDGSVRGFDTGPGNVLMDGWIHRHTGQTFDRDGNWAASDTADHELLHQCLSDPYFAKAPPKSTGRELFNLTWLDRQVATLHRPINPACVQATLASLTAESIAQAIREYAPETQDVFVCGGGAHNILLMKHLQQHCARPVASCAALGVQPDWVEAMAFAWLAKQHIEQQPGNLPEVTGAQRAVILGRRFLP